MKIVLRYLPKRSLLMAMVTTMILFALYYAWNPPSSKSTRVKLARINAEVIDNVLKSPMNSDPSVSDEVVEDVVVVVVANSSTQNFLAAPPEVIEAEPVCQPLELKVANIETSEIYPKLNFNVRHLGADISSSHFYKFCDH